MMAGTASSRRPSALRRPSPSSQTGKVEWSGEIVDNEGKSHLQKSRRRYVPLSPGEGAKCDRCGKTGLSLHKKPFLSMGSSGDKRGMSYVCSCCY